MRLATWLLCAWVVWQNSPLDDGTVRIEHWQPRQGFTNAQACVTAMGHYQEREKDFVFRCLPDTVDPRAPKR